MDDESDKDYDSDKGSELNRDFKVIGKFYVNFDFKI